MGDHHHHDHKGTGSDDQAPDLSFPEKAEKLLAHWIHHNIDHAQNYRQWAAAFNQHGLSDAGALLDAAAELTDQINQKLEQAARLIG